MCASLGFWRPEGRWPARAKTQAEATETISHISHEICYETDKKARQGSRGPSDHLVPREEQGPSDYQRPSQLAGAL